MPTWVIGFLLGSLLLTNALFTSQPLSLLNAVVGVFLYAVIMLNYYGKK